MSLPQPPISREQLEALPPEIRLSEKHPFTIAGMV